MDAAPQARAMPIACIRTQGSGWHARDGLHSQEGVSLPQEHRVSLEMSRVQVVVGKRTPAMILDHGMPMGGVHDMIVPDLIAAALLVLWHAIQEIDIVDGRPSHWLLSAQRMLQHSMRFWCGNSGTKSSVPSSPASMSSYSSRSQATRSPVGMSIRTKL